MSDTIRGAPCLLPRPQPFPCPARPERHPPRRRAACARPTARARPPCTPSPGSTSTSPRARSRRSWARRAPGKSTLMHVLAGLDTATSGQVMLGEHRPDRARRRPSAHAAAPRPGRLRLPVVQPAADVHRRAEHHAAADAGRRSRSDGEWLATAGRRRSALRVAARTHAERALRRPAAAGGDRPRPDHQARTWSSPTSRPATSTPARAPRCCRSCAARSASSAGR